MTAANIPSLKTLDFGGMSVITLELVEMYDEQDYDDHKSGVGQVADLYAGHPDKHWVAQIWTDNKDSVRIETSNACYDEAYTAEAMLLLRAWKKQGLTAAQAFDTLIERYNTNPVTDEVIDDYGARNLRQVDLNTVTGEPGSGVTIS